MQFAVSITGTHAEGPEGKSRLDKLVKAFSEKLHANGFIADQIESTHDKRSFVGEASPTPPEIMEDFEETAPFDLTPPPDLTEKPATTATSSTSTATPGTQAAVLTVEFASNAAAELADHSNLTNTDFEGVEPSGDTGFTTFDVREVIKAKN